MLLTLNALGSRYPLVRDCTHTHIQYTHKRMVPSFYDLHDVFKSELDRKDKNQESNITMSNKDRQPHLGIRWVLLFCLGI